MAREERKKEDLFIKPKEQRRTRKLFVTSSIKMNEKKGVSKTTISSSVFTKMSQSFADGNHLIDNNIRETQGAVMYMLQEMQSDLDDVYNEVSASAFQASFFPFARIDSGSIGVISSSLVPNKDSKYDLGSSGNEWNNLYVDGTAYIDSLDLNGSNITPTSISGSFTSLSASIATDINNAGGGNADFSKVGESIIPTTDNKMDLGSSTKEFKDLYIDVTAYIDSIAGGSLTKPIRTVLSQLTKMKGTTLDASTTDVFEFNIAKAFTIDLITPMFAGQEITIMNIGSGAITITRSTNPKQTGIFGKANLTIGQHEAYKFIVNQNQLWYVIS